MFSEVITELNNYLGNSLYEISSERASLEKYLLIEDLLTTTNAKLVGSRFLNLQSESSDIDFLINMENVTYPSSYTLENLGFAKVLYEEGSYVQLHQSDELHYIRASLVYKTWEIYLGDKKINIMFSNNFDQLYGIYVFCKELGILNGKSKEHRIDIFNALCCLERNRLHYIRTA